MRSLSEQPRRADRTPFRPNCSTRRSSVANLTRRDGEEFLALAPKIPVRTSVEIFPLERANQALARVREGRINGAAALVTETPPQRSR